MAKTPYRIWFDYEWGWIAWHIDDEHRFVTGRTPHIALERLKRWRGEGGYPRG